MKIALHWRILIGLALGVLVGGLINELWTTETWRSLGVVAPADFKAWKSNPENAGAGFLAMLARFLVQAGEFVGRLFVRSLQMVALPIIVCSIVAGAAGIGDPRALGRIGSRTILVFLCTVLIAIVMGLALVNAAQPGGYVDSAVRDTIAAERLSDVEQRKSAAMSPSAWTMALETLPRNPFESLASANYLQVIVFCLLLGVGLSMLPRERITPLVNTLEALGEACITIVHGIMWCSPLAVFCLVVPQVANLGLSVIAALGVYAAVVVAGLVMILFVEYPLILWVFGRRSPIEFFKALAPAQLVALSSSSSNATLPVTLDCTINRLGVSPRVARFVCPLGATINMDGTALYQAIATVFVAQLYGIDLSITDQATVVLLATLSSIGAPGIPSGGIVLLLAMIQSLGLPPEGLAVVLALDRPLDMLRTVVNVSGDALTSAVVDRYEPRTE
jgi:Na+/H+-dicarboxylate symporter